MTPARISVRQAAMLLITPITATGHLLFVRIVFRNAGKDGWISLGIALALGAVGLLILIRLLVLHQGKNLLQIAEELLGSISGRVVGALVLAHLLFVNAVLLRSFGDFMRLVLPQTPLIVLIGVMMLLATRAARHGLEVLARTNDIMLPLLIATGGLLSILISKDKQPRYLMPILENGWQPVLAGALALQGLFAETLLLGMFSHQVAGARSSLHHVLWIIGVLGVLFIGPITGPPTVFGPASVHAMVYPTWEEVKHVQMADLIGNLDVMGVLLWTLGTSMQTSLFLWSTSNGVAWLLKLDDFRAVVAPLAVLTTGLAVLVSDNAQELFNFLAREYPLESILAGVLLPLGLLIWSIIRR
ncbi:MAG TPA: endospore germination permease [Symbiobacteriaceae bacterium]|nr:endospore germination permease [Symbiobacteriaceae bacterium]